MVKSAPAAFCSTWKGEVRLSLWRVPDPQKPFRALRRDPRCLSQSYCQAEGQSPIANAKGGLILVPSDPYISGSTGHNTRITPPQAVVAVVADSHFRMVSEVPPSWPL
jgi:hypothetical protein